MSDLGATITPKHRARGRTTNLSWEQTPTSILSFIAFVVASVALIDLGIRSAVFLNLRWDAFMYHIPFAALRGGLHVTYDMNDTMRPFFEGFPPLPEAVQGLLWRLTGSVNATGVVNFLALAVFLIYCQIVLRAAFWLVALISLTAPIVLIHTAVSYVDLFSNAWLAIGAASCIYLYLFPADSRRAVLIGAAAGLAAAAWSKYQLAPIAALLFVLFAFVSLRPVITARFGRRQIVVVLLSFAALASVPYAKNLILYGNPFWPVKVPVAGGLFPYQIDAVTQNAAAERPQVPGRRSAGTGLRLLPVRDPSTNQLPVPREVDRRSRELRGRVPHGGVLGDGEHRLPRGHGGDADLLRWRGRNRREHRGSRRPALHGIPAAVE